MTMMLKTALTARCFQGVRMSVQKHGEQFLKQTNSMTSEYEEIMESEKNKFADVLSEMFNTYKKKNADYGNSFSETIQEFGYIPAVARINDKLKRVKNMVKGNEMNIKNESLRDNLMDIANYCVLTIVELDNQK